MADAIPTEGIIVGIDFGTTFSGLSWAVKEGIHAIRLVTEWKDPQTNSGNWDKQLYSEKVPSVISYDETGNIKSWGHEVTKDQEHFKWFKILLDADNVENMKDQFTTKDQATLSEQVAELRRLLTKYGKKAKDICKDYLSMLWQVAVRNIAEEKGEDWLERFRVRVVITVPTIWSEKAKAKTRRAAIKAGIPSNISLVPETEAAALFALQDKANKDPTLKASDTFVVCDAGGGTVDLASYELLGLNPLRMQESVRGDGGLCGSIFVNIACERYIRTVLGEQRYMQLRPDIKLRAMEQFETQVKRPYAGSNEEVYRIPMAGLGNEVHQDVKNGKLKLPPHAVAGFFEVVINQIMRLVQQQVSEIEGGKKGVKAILLVGGFGENKFLQNRLMQAHHDEDTFVLRVEDAWTSVCRGATLWGLENASGPRDSFDLSPQIESVTSRLARFSYGVCVENKQATKIDWKIRKRDRLNVGAVFCASMECKTSWMKGEKFNAVVCSSSEDSPPQEKGPKVEQLLSQPFKVKRNNSVPVDLFLQLNSASIRLTVRSRKGKVLADSQTRFTNEDDSSDSE